MGDSWRDLCIAWEFAQSRHDVASHIHINSISIKYCTLYDEILEVVL